MGGVLVALADVIVAVILGRDGQAGGAWVSLGGDARQGAGGRLDRKSVV